MVNLLMWSRSYLLLFFKISSLSLVSPISANEFPGSFLLSYKHHRNIQSISHLKKVFFDVTPLTSVPSNPILFPFIARLLRRAVQ